VLRIPHRLKPIIISPIAAIQPPKRAKRYARHAGAGPASARRKAMTSAINQG